MAASYNQTKAYPFPYTYFIDLFRTLHLVPGMELGFVSELFNQSGVVYNFSHGMSFTSWGEDITVTVTSLPNNQTMITVFSECSMPTQIVDWGKNREVVDDIFRYLDSAIMQRTANGAPQYTTNSSDVCSHCGAGLAANAAFCTTCGHKVSDEPKRFCTTCGNRIVGDALFCTNCGAKVQK